MGQQLLQMLGFDLAQPQTQALEDHRTKILAHRSKQATFQLQKLLALDSASFPSGHLSLSTDRARSAQVI